METKEIVEMSNKLSNEDLSVLIAMNRSRVFVHVTRKDGSHCEELDDEVPSCLNGNSVQINLKNEG
tara:strand:- start:511 stop:708 length:198 start_codon:yes stop_codon:yes gene_type:complete